MARVTIDLPNHHYDVVIEPGLLERAGERIRSLLPHRRCALLADANVLSLHGEGVRASLESAGYATLVASVPTGEEQKTLATVATLYDVLLENRDFGIVCHGGEQSTLDLVPRAVLRVHDAAAAVPPLQAQVEALGAAFRMHKRGA